jgi:hypothetical protein
VFIVVLIVVVVVMVHISGAAKARRLAKLE